ncbi:MAG: hypothetical protein R3F42_13315 [Pseudomonadota bacterium]
MKIHAIIPALMLACPPVYANEVSTQLEAMPAPERANALAGVLRQSGRDCSNVFRIFLQGHDSGDVAFWNVTCSNGKSYNILVNPDPDAQTAIIDCSDMRAIAGIDCFEQFITAD